MAPISTFRLFDFSTLLLAALLLLAGCENTGGTGSRAGSPRPAPPKPIRLTDVTADSGIDLVMTCGATPSTQILEVDGGGLGLVDYDDGDLDLFVANGATLVDPENGPGSRLYENLGGLRFRDVTAAAGIELRRWAMGVAVGDYDGDRRDDLYVTCYGPNVLLRNFGDGRFEDVTEQAGVGDARWGTSAAFADLDGDGDLDLYVVNYLDFDVTDMPRGAKYKGVDVMAGPHGLTPQPDVLYENRGDGTFLDVSEASGCRAEPPAFGLNVVALDLDGDGHQDLYVGNDSMANFLFRNRGTGRLSSPSSDPGAKESPFESVGMLSGAAGNNDGAMQATMGIAVGDVDGNGRPDLFSTNFSSDTNTLHLSMGGPRGGLIYADRTQAYGLGMISRTWLGWTCGLFDLDHDGDEDLIGFNGHVYPQATREAMDSEYEQAPMVFERSAEGFALLSAATAGDWLARTYRHRAGVFGDLDRDGDVDVIVSELNGPVQVLRNDADDERWLIVALRDPTGGNHRGLGSRIELTDGTRTLVRWIYTGGGFQSSSAPEAHFGWPWQSGGLTLTVIWPDGTRHVVEDVSRGRVVVARAER